jgi:hypothetical protein
MEGNNCVKLTLLQKCKWPTVATRTLKTPQDGLKMGSILALHI